MTKKLTRWCIGNILRGYFDIKAPSEEIAWEKGCKRFQKSFPGSRFVVLYRYESVPVRSISKGVPHSSLTVKTPVMQGYTDDKYKWPEVVFGYQVI